MVELMTDILTQARLDDKVRPLIFSLFCLLPEARRPGRAAPGVGGGAQWGRRARLPAADSGFPTPLRRMQTTHTHPCNLAHPPPKPLPQARFTQMVLETKAGLESGIIGSGHRFASARLSAQRSVAGFVGEAMGGLSYLEFIRGLAKRVESDWDGVQVGSRARLAASWEDWELRRQGWGLQAPARVPTPQLPNPSCATPSCPRPPLNLPVPHPHPSSPHPAPGGPRAHPLAAAAAPRRADQRDRRRARSRGGGAPRVGPARGAAREERGAGGLERRAAPRQRGPGGAHAGARAPASGAQPRAARAGPPDSPLISCRLASRPASRAP
jgi:hypothetical protein